MIYNDRVFLSHFIAASERSTCVPVVDRQWVDYNTDFICICIYIVDSGRKLMILFAAQRRRSRQECEATSSRASRYTHLEHTIRNLMKSVKGGNMRSWRLILLYGLHSRLTLHSSRRSRSARIGCYSSYTKLIRGICLLYIRVFRRSRTLVKLSNKCSMRHVYALL